MTLNQNHKIMKQTVFYSALLMLLMLAFNTTSNAQTHRWAETKQDGHNLVANTSIDENSGESGMSVFITQAGDNHYANASVQNVQNSVIRIEQINNFEGGGANGNSADVTQFEARNLTFDLKQQDYQNVVNATQTGNDHYIIATQKGSENVLNIHQVGSFNRSYNLSQDDPSATSIFDWLAESSSSLEFRYATVDGFDSSDGIIQDGTGNYGEINQNGNNGIVFLYQEGEWNTTNISQAESGNNSDTWGAAIALQKGTSNTINISN